MNPIIRNGFFCSRLGKDYRADKDIAQNLEKTATEHNGKFFLA